MIRPYIRYAGAVYRLAEPTKTLLITDGDMDGSCCAIATQMAYPDTTVEYENHSTVSDRVRKLIDNPEGYDQVVIADMLPSDEKLVRELHQKFPGQVRIFDHHETQDYLNDLEGCRHDKGACSGLICAQELVGPHDELTPFAETIDLYDRFQHDAPGFDDAQKLMRLHNWMGQPAFVERGAKASLDDNEQSIVGNIERAEQGLIDESLKALRKFRDKDGHVFALLIGINSPIMHSSTNVAHAIYASDDSVDYVAVWHPNGARAGSVSLYSRDGGLDVSELARNRGGGGHQGAAGFKPTADLGKLIAKNLFGKMS